MLSISHQKTYLCFVGSFFSDSFCFISSFEYLSFIRWNLSIRFPNRFGCIFVLGPSPCQVWPWFYKCLGVILAICQFRSLHENQNYVLFMKVGVVYSLCHMDYE